MPQTFRRYNFLTKLFPPAGPLPPQPGSVSDEIAFVHQVLNGTDRLVGWKSISIAGGGGVSNISSSTVPDDKYWKTFAVDALHDDTTDRDLFISIVGFGGSVLAVKTSDRAVPANIHLGVDRNILLPPRFNLRADCPLIGAGKILILRAYYMELDLGEPPHPD